MKRSQNFHQPPQKLRWRTLLLSLVKSVFKLLFRPPLKDLSTDGVRVLGAVVAAGTVCPADRGRLSRLTLLMLLFWMMMFWMEFLALWG